MAARTYRPHIRVQIGARWNSLVGWLDLSALGLRYWECDGHGAHGSGSTPKEAYDAWYKEFLMPYQYRGEFVSAYQSANTPQFAPT